MKKSLVLCRLFVNCGRFDSGEDGGVIYRRWNHPMLSAAQVVQMFLSLLGVFIPTIAAVVMLGSLVGCKGEIRFSHTCGDGVAQGSEVCDGDDLRGEDCVSQGYTGGTLGCNEGCDAYDTSQCTGTGPVCGDDVAQGSEVCDGDDLQGEDCVSQGFTGGELGCNEGCDAYDTSGCLTTVCGDDVADEGEVCDGDDLRGEDCVSQGFSGGTLSCNGDCTGYNTSGCYTSLCGNDIAEEGEVCDGIDLGGEDCVSQGFSSGSLSCNADCNGFITTDCSATEVELVCNRWNMDRADRSEGTWSGSVGSCDAGDVSALGRANALKLVNLYRFIAGLPEVTTNSGRDDAAQECALMMDANGQLSHSPPSTWDCYTSTGAGAAGSSNIAGGPGVQAVDMYMDDYGNSSTLGHRRWILSNSLGAIGLGSTSSYSCMWVIGTGGNAGAQWTAWPSPGVFPFEAISTLYWSSLDDTGWSFQSDSIGLSNAEVTVTSGGQELPVTVTNLLGGYGSSSAISFIPDGWSTQPDTNYTVEITGITSPVTYEVQVVQCN